MSGEGVPFFRRGVVKNVSGSYNAVYILPRALYTKMDQTLIYSVATGIIGGKENNDTKTNTSNRPKDAYSYHP